MTMKVFGATYLSQINKNFMKELKEPKALHSGSVIKDIIHKIQEFFACISRKGRIDFVQHESKIYGHVYDMAKLAVHGGLEKSEFMGIIRDHYKPESCITPRSDKNLDSFYVKAGWYFDDLLREASERKQGSLSPNGSGEIKDSSSQVQTIKEEQGAPDRKDSFSVDVQSINEDQGALDTEDSFDESFDVDLSMSSKYDMWESEEDLY